MLYLIYRNYLSYKSRLLFQDHKISNKPRSRRRRPVATGWIYIGVSAPRRRPPAGIENSRRRSARPRSHGHAPVAAFYWQAASLAGFSVRSGKRPVPRGARAAKPPAGQPGNENTRRAWRLPPAGPRAASVVTTPAWAPPSGRCRAGRADWLPRLTSCAAVIPYYHGMCCLLALEH